MNTQPDFEKFLQLLEAHKVEYLIVGGYAVAYHGYPRFTKDLDIFYSDTESNIQNIQKLLVEFGFPEEKIPIDLFSPGAILNFGVEPVRIDLINRIDGVSFAEALQHSVRGVYGKQSVNFIGIEELKQNKASTGRIQDAADLEKLRERSG